MRQSYYPPGTAPQGGPHCGWASEKEMHRIYGDGLCKLLQGHDGEHDYEANWHAHVDVESTISGGLEIGFRSWHDSRALRVENRAEADTLIAFLNDCFDAQFGTENSGSPAKTTPDLLGDK